MEKLYVSELVKLNVITNEVLRKNLQLAIGVLRKNLPLALDSSLMDIATVELEVQCQILMNQQYIMLMQMDANSREDLHDLLEKRVVFNSENNRWEYNSNGK